MEVSLPQELTDKIIDEVARDPVLRTATLQASSLVSRAWVHRSQKYLLSEVKFDEGRFYDWCLTVRPGEDGPSRHVTCLHYRADDYSSYPTSLVEGDIYLSSFTNVQTLHLSNAGLEHVEYAFSLMRLRSTIHSIVLRNCRMNINELVIFLRPFTNLENLSLRLPYTQQDPELEKQGRIPTLKGRLDFEPDPETGEWPLMHGLSLLPLAFYDIVFRNFRSFSGGAQELLMASRKTLTVIRIPTRKSSPVTPST